MSDTKPFMTWRQLKEIANQIQDFQLDKPVIIWEDIETVVYIHDHEVFTEDYIECGDDEFCAPRSEMKDMIEEEINSGKDPEESFPVRHPKGTIMLHTSKE